MTEHLLCKNETHARKIFKSMAGQNNHFLITILVGLAAVENGDALLPSDMHTSWDPKDLTRSAARSRQFAIKAQLAWLIDSLDAYIRALRRESAIIPENLERRLKEADNERGGLSRRLRAIGEETGQGDTAELALADLSITWRNNLVHEHVERKGVKAVLESVAAHWSIFHEQYQHLDVDLTIDRFGQSPPVAPTFKEITAIIRAGHKFVERADAFLLRSLDLEADLNSLLVQYLNDGDTDSRNAMKRINNIWGRTLDRRRSTILQIARQGGFSDWRSDSINLLSSASIDQLIALTPRQAAARFNIQIASA